MLNAFARAPRPPYRWSTKGVFVDLHIRLRTVVPCLLLALLGCNLSAEKLETQIKKEFEEKGVTLKEVTCPKDKKDKAGEEFECQGETEDGTKFTVAVKAKGSGAVQWDLMGKIVEPGEIQDNLKKSGTEYDCGKSKRVAVKGVVIKCTAGNKTVNVKFTNDEGQYEAEAK